MDRTTVTSTARVKADEAGNGHSVALQTWSIAPGEGPKSVIIHATTTDPVTGLAGARLACVDVAV
jgi:hypothetical protein